MTYDRDLLTPCPVLNWTGCYDDSWKGLITDESFAHPAKYARGLIERIIGHGLQRGWWWQRGMVQVTAEILREILADIDAVRYYLRDDCVTKRQSACEGQTANSTPVASQPTKDRSERSQFDAIEATGQGPGSRSHRQMCGGQERSLNGSESLGSQCQKDSSSTISTETPLTTESRTCPSSSERRTPNSTASSLPQHSAGRSCQKETCFAPSAEHSSKESTNGASAIVTPAAQKQSERLIAVTSSGYVVDLESLPSVGDMIEREPSLLGDPFGGIGTGGITCSTAGLRWIGVELEPRFVAMAENNFDLNERPMFPDAHPRPVIVQGDSRRFAELVQASGIVTSPPYSESMTQGNSAEQYGCKNYGGGGQLNWPQQYGSTPGQIGRLREGELGAVVTSPPFGEDQPCQSQTKEIRDYHAFTRGDGTKRDQTMRSDGQISGLPQGSLDGIVQSPPYADSVQGAHHERETADESWQARSDPKQGGSLGKSQRHGGYGSEPGNIGNLKEGALDGVVTSPPFAKQSHHGGDTPTARGIGRNTREQRPTEAAGNHNLTRTYGATEGQIDETEGETYWRAMDQVYRQCWLALRPGGYMAVVVKDYIKKGRRVPLCDQTLQLLVHIGFEPVERIHAHLTQTVFENGRERTIERKSFFRRLAEKKGSPRIDWEEVLVVRAHFMPGTSAGGRP